MLKRLVRETISKVIGKYGYKLVRPPRALQNNPDSELALSLALLIESLMCRQATPPFILQIGANDGCNNDHLNKALLKYNLPALLVEPQPEIFERLKETYRGKNSIQFANCAIGETDGSATLYVLHPDYHDFYPHRPDGLSSFSKDHILRHLPESKRNPDAVIGTNVKLSSIDTLLKDHGVTGVDVLVIDTEGFDWEILKLFNIPKRLPSVIQFEWHNLQWTTVEEALEFLVSHGYRVHLLKGDVLAYRGYSLDKI